MLARERLERRGFALDLLLARRVHVECVEIVPQRVRRFAHQNHSLAEQLRRRPKFRVHLHHRAQRPRGLAEQIVRARALLVVHGVERGARRLSEPPSAGDALLFGEQRLDIGGGGDLALELGELVAQQLEPRLAVLGSRPERFEFGAAGAVATVQIGNGGNACRLEARIEEFALRAALHQVLVLLLAMNLDEQIGELAQ